MTFRLMIVKYKMVQFIFLLVIHTFILAQISSGGDAELRFGESKNNYNFSEILLNMNITNDDLATWFQFEYSDPPELGLNMNGLRKFRVDYTSGPLELSVGDIYKIRSSYGAPLHRLYLERLRLCVDTPLSDSMA